MLRNVSMVLVAAAVSVWSGGELFAQAQGFGSSLLSSGGGGTGSGGSSFGSSGSSFGGGSSSSGTGGSLGSNGSGMSMMNAANLSGGFGLLGFGSMNGFTTGGASSMYGGRSYGSVTTAGGSSTAGGAAGGARSTSSTSTSSAAGRGGSTSANSSARGRRSTGTSGSTPKEEPVWFEPRIEVGFDVPPPKTSAIALNLATSMGTTKVGSRFGGVRVAVDGQTAILRGIVASQNDRQLAEQITLLEPSIVSVRNELVIQRRATAPAGSR